MAAINWQRVSRSNPCPICHHPDWCLISPDGTGAICARTPSDNRRGESGWYHQLSTPTGPYAPRPTRLAAPVIDRSDEAREYNWHAVDNGYLAILSAQLKVSQTSLAQLCVGWCPAERCWTFPLFRPQDNICTGIMRRFEDGSKKMFPGHRAAGLYAPALLDYGDTLVICEGATDTAAALDLGLTAVGRFSCSGGAYHIRALIRELHTRDAVVIADTGNSQEIDGAERLRDELSTTIPTRVFFPPAKDLRAWVLQGVKPDYVKSVICQMGVATCTSSNK